MKVYLINLDRSPDRLSWFRRQTEGMDIDLVRVPAVDAKNLPESELDRLRALSSGRRSRDQRILSAGEIGCFLSHRKIWEIVAKDDESWAFVAEDDIHFSSQAATFLRAGDWIPQGADLIKAETNLRRHELSVKLWGQAEGHELRGLRSYHFGSGGYFISPKAAAHLLAFTERRCDPVDEILFSPTLGVLKQIEVLQISPAICIQDVYLQEHTDTDVLQSVIERERVTVRRGGREKRLAAKLVREIRRLGAQIAETLRRVVMIGTGRAVFRRVGFVEKGTTLRTEQKASREETPRAAASS
jgi:glycosyl transferase family 25